VDELLELCVVFLRAGLLAFGGSVAALPELERAVVVEHGWLTRRELVDSFALGQLTPGPALLMVMFAGYNVAGVPGAVVSLVAIFLPSAALTSLAVAWWGRLSRNRWLASAQRAVAGVSFGLVAAGAYSIVRLAVTDGLSAVIMVAATVALWYWRPHPAAVMLAGGAAAGLAGLLGA
jgi:chromate transporter